MIYKTLTRQTLTCGSEGWPLSKKDGNTFRIFERKISESFKVLLTIMVYGE